MENNIQIFNNVDFGDVRVVMNEQNEPMFCGVDVAKALGYERPTNAVARHIDEEDKICLTQSTISREPQNGASEENNENSANLMTKTTYINESGVYCLCLRSKLKSAKRFKRWITNEVLPSIRKNGLFFTDQTVEQIAEDPDSFMAKAMLVANAVIAKKQKQIMELTNAVAIKDQQIKEFEPKVTYYNQVISSNSAVSVTIIAKDYGYSAVAFNKLLHDLHVQFKVVSDGTWVLYSEHADKGYTKTKTTEFNRIDGSIGTRVSTKWTQAGRLFLYDLLKTKNILPLIETSN